jgi:hypothetical protein
MQTSVPGVHKYQNPRKTKHLPDSRAEPDYLRKAISKFPGFLKNAICEMIALSLYFPLSRIAWLVERFDVDVSHFPLSYYRTKPYYQLRNDALDRFGTRLEQRFSKPEIARMLENSGFEKITFSDSTPFWCCVAYKS